MQRERCFINSLIPSLLLAGCSSGFLLREADVSPVQLERPGRFVGVRLSGRHPGLAGLHWREQDPGHPPSPAPAANAAPTEVHLVHPCTTFCVCV